MRLDGKEVVKWETVLLLGRSNTTLHSTFSCLFYKCLLSGDAEWYNPAEPYAQGVFEVNKASGGSAVFDLGASCFTLLNNHERI